ncbi:MAG: hypothetical protein E7477_01680 [Ruminococcaceae bacterium]|nr:hypothetical protein [Oscillospiraceae bacterium]
MNSFEIKELLTHGDINSVIHYLSCNKTNGISVLTAILMLAEDAKEKYNKMNIPEEIFNDTMADISIWAENYRRKTGYCGIEELGWIMNHLNLDLFAIGRLQFRPSSFYFNNNIQKLFDFDIKEGEGILEIHIPQGKPLYDEECDMSIKSAPIFFKNYFDYDFNYFTCHSWLLSPVLKDILPKESNIIKFQNRFTLIAYDPNDMQAEERIFDKQFGANANSSLAKKVRELNEKGKHIGCGIGIIKREDITNDRTRI